MKMNFKSILLITGTLCITLLNAGCGQKAADTPTSSPGQATAATPLTPEQQAQKDAYAKNQEAMMKAQAQAQKK